GRPRGRDRTHLTVRSTQPSHKETRHMDRDDAPRILLPRATAERLAASMSRRRFLAASGASAMALWLAACGSDSNNSSSGGTSGGTETQGTGGAGGGNVDRNINMFTWAEY